MYLTHLVEIILEINPCEYIIYDFKLKYNRLQNYNKSKELDSLFKLMQEIGTLNELKD